MGFTGYCGPRGTMTFAIAREDPITHHPPESLEGLFHGGRSGETTCGTLGVKKTCDVVARYDVLDGDPFDLDSGSASGYTFGIVGDPQARFAIPEPATWVELLVGFSALGFPGYLRARSRQL